MNCDCQEKVNEKLKGMNLRLSGYALIMPKFEAVVQIATSWIDRDKAPKGKKHYPTAMLASHCPFCGIPINKTNTEKT